DPVRVVRPAGDPELIERAARLLGQAQRPLIYAGGGIMRAGAAAELQALAELLEAPVLTTVNARGALSDRHHLALSDLVAADVAADADVLLVVGSRFLIGGAATWQPGA